MSRMPDLIGYELEKGLKNLENSGLQYRLVENSVPQKTYDEELPKRIVRQKLLPSGEVEVLYSFDTYQVKKESHL